MRRRRKEKRNEGNEILGRKDRARKEERKMKGKDKRK
jgi:hypothetical protein